MSLWIETILVIGIAFVGLLTGAGISRLGKRAGLAACAVSIVLILFLVGARLYPEQLPNFIFWAFVSSRIKFILLSWFVPMGLAAAMPYLPRKSERWLTTVLIALFIYGFSVFPFLGAAIAAEELMQNPPRFDHNGVCRQSMPFTCGPAAAATALHHLGVDIGEGQLTQLSRCGMMLGTGEWELFNAVQTAADGRLDCEFVRCEDIPALADNQILLITLRQGVLYNHCAAILEADSYTVLLADPAEGLFRVPVYQVRQIWTKTGILLTARMD